MISIDTKLLFQAINADSPLSQPAYRRLFDVRTAPTLIEHGSNC